MMKSNTLTPWVVAFALCLILSVVITSIWVNETTTYTSSPQQITTKSEVDEYVKLSLKEGKQTQGGKHVVPVGFFTQSVKFVNSSDVNVTGYIWHKYPLDFPEELQQGFIFPEVVSSGDEVIQKAYTEQHDNYVLKGWYFDVTVRQSFDYKKFPLDRKAVWLRLWPKDWSESVIFTPDLESYESVAPGVAFGMDQNTVMGQWEIFETYFDYKKVKYDTNFGSSYKPDRDNPELYFNVIVGRKFVNSFVIYLVPLFIILAMLFSILMMTTKDDNRKGIFGSSTSGAIGSTVALFFVVTLAHAQIREQFAGAGLVYMESFYFIAYIMILLVSLNTYHFTSTDKEYRIYQNDNLTAKLLYWPVILLFILASTILYFF